MPFKSTKFLESIDMFFFHFNVTSAVSLNSIFTKSLIAIILMSRIIMTWCFTLHCTYSAACP